MTEYSTDRPKKVLARSKADRQKLEKVAAYLFSRIIKRRDGWCTMAGSHVECMGTLDCAHVITRSNHTLRYRLFNAHALCRAHHTFYHANEALWIGDCLKKWPDETGLCLLFKNTPETDEDLEAIIRELRELLITKYVHL